MHVPSALRRAFFSLRETIMESLFPTPKAEREIFAMGESGAWRELPRAEHPALGEACSIFAYKDERVWRLIWALKYKKSRQAAAISGYALYRALSYMMIAVTATSIRNDSNAPRFVVVPMPVSRKRRRERGYNQCELLLDEIGRLDVANRFIFTKGLLVRSRHTQRQTKKSRAERLESAHDLFSIDEKAREQLNDGFNNNGMRENSLIIVIDDVVTTGSTIKGAIDTLKSAGFSRVYGLSLAH